MEQSAAVLTSAFHQAVLGREGHQLSRQVNSKRRPGQQKEGMSDKSRTHKRGHATLLQMANNLEKIFLILVKALTEACLSHE